LLALKAGAQSVTFSPDGKQLATGSGDNTVKVWDSETGRELLTLTDAGRKVSFSPDGKRLASASPSLVKLWDSQTGQLLLTINSGNAVYFAVFSPDGERLATSAVGPTIKIWDAQTGQEKLTLNSTRNNGTWGVAFSPDGKRLASGGGDRTVKIWDAATGEELFAFQGHSNIVTSVAFSPDGITLVSGSQDGTVKLWDATTSPVARTLSRAAGRVNGIVFGPNGKRIVSSDEGGWNAATRTRGPGEVNVRDVQTGRELLSIKGQIGQDFACVALSPDGKRLAAGNVSLDSTGQADFQGEVKIWDSASGQELLTIKAHSDGVNNLAFSPDGQRLASSAAGLWDVTKQAYLPGEVKLWDAETGREVLSLKGHTSRILALAFSPDGQRLATYDR
jgi:WD40 repeat protein